MRRNAMMTIHNKLLKTYISLLAICGLNYVLGDPTSIISRADWSTATPDNKLLVKLDLPVGRAIITHSAGSDCSNKEACVLQLNNIQNYHMDVLHYVDIAYNFLVGNDGNVYEGRGWDVQGAFAKGFNNGSLGICFIGHFERNLPSDAALMAAKGLLEYAQTNGKLQDDYKLFGHRQVAPTESPGNALYTVIQQWPHWSANTRY